MDDQNDLVFFGVIAQTDVSQAEKGIDGGVDGHLIVIIVGGGIRKVGEPFGDFGQELFHAHSKLLYLKFFRYQGNGLFVRGCLQVENALPRRANSVGSDTVDRV